MERKGMERRAWKVLSRKEGWQTIGAGDSNGDKTTGTELENWDNKDKHKHKDKDKDKDNYNYNKDTEECW